jgi:RecJ-like exonuclease
MPDVDAMRRVASEKGLRLRAMAKEKVSIIVLGHVDADGMASVGLMARALAANGAIFTARAVPDVNLRMLHEMASEGFDFHVFCEVGSGHLKDIEAALGGKYMLIDHHQLTEEERESPNVFNVNAFGVDGSRELSGAGATYMLARNMVDDAKPMSWLSVVGALGDRQDRGSKHTLIGMNEQLAAEAISSGYLDISEDLLLFGRSVRPLHESIAMTFDPYIQGLTGNKDACLAALTSAGLLIKDSSRWRVAAELTPDEKEKLLATLSPYLDISGADSSAVWGTTYLLKREDERSYLRDARDFASLLDATGRMGKAGLGIAICLGDRGAMLTDAERTLLEYRNAIMRHLRVLLSDEERISQDGQMVQLVGDGIVQENMTGAVSNALSGMPQLRGKMILLRTITKSGEIKFSIRKGLGSQSKVNLGQVMLQSAAFVGGNGGGHDSAAGARIPAVKADIFYEKLKSGLR